MAEIEQFLAMGGYAAFVWPAFAVAAAVLVGLLVVSLRTLRRREAALAALLRDAAEKPL
ncbi:MAG: heme exporter protein CcmD [Dongiaceae bacterium]|jgi:heme exporter protein D